MTYAIPRQRPPEAESISHLVYINPSLRMKRTHVEAATDIPPSTLLMIEHAFVGDSRACAVAVAADRKLFDLLYKGNNKPHALEDFGGVAWLADALNKVHYNSFATTVDDNIVQLIGGAASRFNHSCHNNAMTVIKTPFIIVLSVRSIKAGSEVCVHYDVDAGHYNDPQRVHDMNPDVPILDYGFTCGCGQAPQQRLEYLPTLAFKMLAPAEKATKKEVAQRVTKYMQTERYKQVVSEQQKVHAAFKMCQVL